MNLKEQYIVQRLTTFDKMNIPKNRNPPQDQNTTIRNMVSYGVSFVNICEKINRV